MYGITNDGWAAALGFLFPFMLQAYREMEQTALNLQKKVDEYEIERQYQK